jgi:hypothetical protein
MIATTSEILAEDDSVFSLVAYSSDSDDDTTSGEDEEFDLNNDEVDVNIDTGDSIIGNINDSTQLCSQHTVENIPESLRVVTLLRQFLEPKPHGSVVSKDQLNLEKLEPFIQAFSQMYGNGNKRNGSDEDTPSGIEKPIEKLNVLLELNFQGIHR